MTDKSAYTRAPHIVETPSLDAALQELARLAEENEKLAKKNEQLEIENIALRSQLYDIEQLSDFEGNESRAEMIRALDAIFEIIIVGRALSSQPADAGGQP